MVSDAKTIRPGAKLKDQIGRVHQISDVFVPKNMKSKQSQVPSCLRYSGRKVIVFASGAVMGFADVQKRYSLAC
ncbi:hypothetical protein SAMN02745866_01365 [Alteromonadaceae bacterium Bs31]|nr:hypothetical protein SAMN02745866_01365 [Alteromonadaceae bacterium Bs31]